MSDIFSSKKLSFTYLLEGENRRNNVYASSLGTCSFRFRGFKDKNMLCWYIKRSKTKNELERRHSEVKKPEASYGPQISSLTCNKKCTGNVFKKLDKSSNVGLIYLEVLKNIYEMK